MFDLRLTDTKSDGRLYISFHNPDNTKKKLKKVNKV
jgi:hypothetical protein